MNILRYILLENFVIKIVSFVLAVLTWIYITGQLYKESTIEEKEAPSIIRVSGEKQIVKTLPIYVNIEGDPAEGFRVVLNKIVIKPSSSVVAGPAEVIKELSYITTEPVNIDGTNSSLRRNVKLSAVPNCKIGYDGFVSVSVPITRERRK